jgi:hypothetical protein
MTFKHVVELCYHRSALTVLWFEGYAVMNEHVHKEGSDFALGIAWRLP